MIGLVSTNLKAITNSSFLLLLLHRRLACLWIFSLFFPTFTDRERSCYVAELQSFQPRKKSKRRRIFDRGFTTPNQDQERRKESICFHEKKKNCKIYLVLDLEQLDPKLGKWTSPSRKKGNTISICLIFSLINDQMHHIAPSPHYTPLNTTYRTSWLDVLSFCQWQLWPWMYNVTWSLCLL